MFMCTLSTIVAWTKKNSFVFTCQRMRSRKKKRTIFYCWICTSLTCFIWKEKLYRCVKYDWSNQLNGTTQVKNKHHQQIADQLKISSLTANISFKQCFIFRSCQMLAIHTNFNTQIHIPMCDSETQKLKLATNKQIT